MTRVALVTGAARGQGAAIASRLAADGFKVAACDVNAEALRDTVEGMNNPNVVAVDLDVRCAQHWNTAVNTVLDAFGALSTLVNNAGVLHRAALVDETPDGFERSWRVNTLGPFLGIQACLPALTTATDASVVNTLSTAAVQAFARHAAYGSSKWALRGLTQIAAAELAPHRVRVNAVLPGAIDTPMLDPATRHRLANGQASRGLGTPQHIADAVAFLVSERAEFITGAELVVDGGQSLSITPEPRLTRAANHPRKDRDDR